MPLTSEICWLNLPSSINAKDLMVNYEHLSKKAKDTPEVPGKRISSSEWELLFQLFFHVVILIFTNGVNVSFIALLLKETMKRKIVLCVWIYRKKLETQRWRMRESNAHCTLNFERDFIYKGSILEILIKIKLSHSFMIITFIMKLNFFWNFK